MPNPNPKTEQLALGRGKRPKLNNETVSMRMSPETRQILEKIAQSYNCMYGNKPWIAGLLEKIGSGDLIIVPAPNYIAEKSTSKDFSEAVGGQEVCLSSKHAQDISSP